MAGEVVQLKPSEKWERWRRRHPPQVPEGGAVVEGGLKKPFELKVRRNKESRMRAAEASRHPPPGLKVGATDPCETSVDFRKAQAFMRLEHLASAIDLARRTLHRESDGCSRVLPSLGEIYDTLMECTPYLRK